MRSLRVKFRDPCIPIPYPLILTGWERMENLRLQKRKKRTEWTGFWMRFIIFTRDIKGRRENLSPIFVIGGRYERKNPFFENRIRVDENSLNTAPLKEIMEEEQQIREHTFVGVMTGMFRMKKKSGKILEAATVGDAFAGLKKEVKDYYEGH